MRDNKLSFVITRLMCIPLVIVCLLADHVAAAGNESGNYECVTNRGQIQFWLGVLGDEFPSLSAETNVVKAVDTVLLENLARRVQNEPTNIVVKHISYFTTPNYIIAVVYTRENRIWEYYRCYAYCITAKDDWKMMKKLDMIH